MEKSIAHCQLAIVKALIEAGKRTCYGQRFQGCS